MTHRQDVEKAVPAQQIFRRNVFPEMNVQFGTYPNNVGHMDFPGASLSRRQPQNQGWQEDRPGLRDVSQDRIAVGSQECGIPVALSPGLAGDPPDSRHHSLEPEDHEATQ